MTAGGQGNTLSIIKDRKPVIKQYIALVLGEWQLDLSAVSHVASEV